LKKGITNSTVYDVKNFEERYNLKVNQFVDFKALKGDPSDNIPGVKGIGEKTAMELLQKYISLDNIYENIDKYLADPMLNTKDKK
jgi:DNA polymerase-1